MDDRWKCDKCEGCDHYRLDEDTLEAYGGEHYGRCVCQISERYNQGTSGWAKACRAYTPRTTFSFRKLIRRL